MIKSHLGATENAGVLVTVQHVGQNVVVGGLGKGVLRYVGTVNGKDGIYCGIELLESAGKHDGTFQGTTYFVCPPERGIFAPTFRVKLDGGGDHGKPPELSSQLLSRSALPTLPLRHSNTSYEPQHPSMPLQIVPNGSGTQSEETVDADAMQMSMLSEMMYGSTCSIGSWGEGSMTMSNATFTVRKGASHDEEYDLMNVPMMKSVLNIDRESLRREEQRLQTSVVLGESRIGVECLPIIEDEELETPLVEMKLPGFTSTQVAPEIPEAVAKPVPDEQVDVNDNPTDVVPASNASKSNSTSTASSSATNTSTGCIERLTTQRNGQPKSNAVQKTSEKKVSAPAAPAPPRFPVKPKAPTKHQLMMEQLKASIEAEKARPKKEVKSRLSVVSPSSSTEKAERSDANAGPEDSKKSSRSLSIASKQQSCLVLGKSKKDGKLTSPPSAKVLTSSKPEISKDALCSKSGDITVAKRKQESKMAPASRVTNIASHKEKANKTDALGVARLDDVRKLALLQRACKMIDVLSLVAQQQCNQCEVYLTRKQKTLENLERATVRISKLEKRLVDDEKTNAEANQCARDRLEKGYIFKWFL